MYIDIHIVLHHHFKLTAELHYLSSSGYWTANKHMMMMIATDNDDNIRKAYCSLIICWKRLKKNMKNICQGSLYPAES
jgi:hypothetical protein